MTDRYFGKIVVIRDKFTVVLNKGEEDGVEANQKYLVVGLGEIITDPDTNEELEQLEIVKGRVIVEHVQPKISTLKSYEYEKTADIKEIKKVTSRGGIAILGPQDTITESIKPGEQHLKPLAKAEIGDRVIKL